MKNHKESRLGLRTATASAVLTLSVILLASSPLPAWAAGKLPDYHTITITVSRDKKKGEKAIKGGKVVIGSGKPKDITIGGFAKGKAEEQHPLPPSVPSIDNTTSGKAADQANASPVSECSFDGRWDSDWGRMEFHQKGSSVKGAYTYDAGRIAGTVNGKVLTGTWAEAPTYRTDNSDGGDATFTLSADCKSFSGRWRYGRKKESWDGRWAAVRAVAEGGARGVKVGLSGSKVQAPAPKVKVQPKPASSKEAKPAAAKPKQPHKPKPRKKGKQTKPVKWTAYKLVVKTHGSRLPTMDVLKLSFQKGAKRAAFRVMRYPVSMARNEARNNQTGKIIWSINWSAGDVVENEMAIQKDMIDALEDMADDKKKGAVRKPAVAGMINGQLGPDARQKK